MWYQKEKNACHFDKHVFQSKIISYLCDAACKGRNSQGSDKRKMCTKECNKVVNNVQVKLQNNVARHSNRGLLRDSVNSKRHLSGTFYIDIGNQLR